MAAWASLVLSVVHGIGVWAAFAGAHPRIPITDPFVRWELLNIEFCFTTLVAVTSVLAIATATSAPLIALAALWAADAVFLVLWPMPLAAGVGWVPLLVAAALALLALLCWHDARGRARAGRGARQVSPLG